MPGLAGPPRLYPYALHMRRLVDVDRLIDARDVARIVGLSDRKDVATYLRRYKDMPRPVIDLGRGRAKLWLRPEVERWQAKRKRSGAVRAGRS